MQEIQVPGTVPHIHSFLHVQFVPLKEEEEETQTSGSSRRFSFSFFCCCAEIHSVFPAAQLFQSNLVLFVMNQSRTDKEPLSGEKVSVQI